MRRWGTSRYVLVLTLLMVLGGAATAWAAAGAYHEDDRFGFKVRTPKGWNQVALSADEQWIAGDDRAHPVAGHGEVLREAVEADDGVGPGGVGEQVVRWRIGGAVVAVGLVEDVRRAA